MDLLKMLFPFSFKSKDVTSLVIAIVIYVLFGAVCGLVIGFLSSIPVLGIIFSLVGSVLGLYGLIGIVLAVLTYFNLIKE